MEEKKSFNDKYKHCIRCPCKGLLKRKGGPVNSEEAQNRKPRENAVCEMSSETEERFPRQ